MPKKLTKKEIRERINIQKRRYTTYRRLLKIRVEKIHKDYKQQNLLSAKISCDISIVYLKTMKVAIVEFHELARKLSKK